MNNATPESALAQPKEVWVDCPNCTKKFKIDQMLREEQMSSPHDTMVEGYLLCPSCGHRQHSYYLTEALRFQQVQLKKALDWWNATKSIIAWREYARKQKTFQTNWDNTQKRYARLHQKEKTVEPGG